MIWLLSFVITFWDGLKAHTFQNKTTKNTFYQDYYAKAGELSRFHNFARFQTASPRGSSPRWNEPDRDYTPSAKKAKKAASSLPTSSAQLQASVGPMAKTPSKATGAKKGRVSRIYQIFPLI